MADEKPTPDPIPAVQQEKAVAFETNYVVTFLKNAKQRSMATPEFKDKIQAAIDVFKSVPKTTIPS
jgi:hypothetical protein